MPCAQILLIKFKIKRMGCGVDGDYFESIIYRKQHIYPTKVGIDLRVNRPSSTPLWDYIEYAVVIII